MRDPVMTVLVTTALATFVTLFLLAIGAYTIDLVRWVIRQLV